MTSKHLSILIAIIILLLNTGCDRDLAIEKNLENQIIDKNVTIQTLSQ